MFHAFTAQLSQSRRSFCAYFKEEKALRWFIGLAIVFLYGIRLVHEDVFVDSDIMMVSPEKLEVSWYGHQRFGLILTRRLFFLTRLLPWHQSALFGLAMWALVLGICFCIRQWSGKASGYRRGAFLFAAIFLSAPCFAEQFLFVLQAFESAAAMGFCVAAAYCSGKWIYDRGSILWTVPALLFMVWAFGSYQAYPAFYIALTVISYLTVYLHREEVCGLREGLLQAALFVAGFLLSQVCARLLCRLHGASASYVNHMFCWGKEPLDVCISNILVDYRRIYMAEWPVFFSRWFRCLAAAAVLITLFHGFKRHSRRFPCFLLALLLLPLTPYLTTLITAMPQPIRSHMTYPLVFAYCVMGLYVGTAAFPAGQRVTGLLKKAACCLIMVFGLVLGWKNGMTMGQLWETAHEAYVSDKLTANRMYSDICRAANRSDMDGCKVVFIGSREAQIAGTPVLGDVIGHSFFQWDTSDPVAANLRINTFFETLGLFMEEAKIEDCKKAAELAAGKPNWPARDSVFVTEDGTVVVKLSDASP